MRRADLRSLLLICVSIALSAGAGCRRAEPPAAAAVRPTPVRAPTIRFDERAADVGVAFVHVNGAGGRKWMPETMGGGVAVFDYDRDGRMDLLFVSGARWPGDPMRKGQSSSLALYRNEANTDAGLPRFRARTAAT